MVTIPGAEGYKDIFYNSPSAMLIISADAPVYTILEVNNAFLSVTNTQREGITGKPFFEIFPANKPDDASTNNTSVLFSFEQALITKVPYEMNKYRYDIPVLNSKDFEERYWRSSTTPMLDKKGNVVYFIYSVINVTEVVKKFEINKDVNTSTETEENNSAKNKIEEAEERARLAVAAVGLGTFDLDLLTGEMVTSAQFAKIFGFDKPVPRSEYIAVFHGDDLRVRNKAHKDAVITGKLMYEARVIWKDESIHWVRVEGKVIYNSKFEAIRILGTLLDISEQRKAKEEQRKLITLVNNSVDLMCIISLDGTNSYVNEAGRNLMGYENEEQVMKVPISGLHAPGDFEFIEKEVFPVVMSKGRWAGVIHFKHLKTGEVFPAFNNCIRIDDPVSGYPIAIGAVMRDMRPELAAKQALEDSEQLLKNITSAAPAALWMSDEKGAIIYNNQTWLQWTGRSYEESLGDGWFEAIFDKDRQRVKEKFISDMMARNTYEAEFRLDHSDGTIHWCTVNGKPQYRNDGNFSGYIGACVDITEQKHLQQQKDDFIAIASHELKTPVTSIKGYTQVLERIFLKKGDTKEATMMSRMDTQINRLTTLIGDLLDVTKINAGKLQFNDRPFDFNPMVKELIEDLQRTTSIHTLVENYDESTMVYGDKERIGQVITNLITNAVKYSPHSDKIVISTFLKDNEITLCVQDFGIGIPEDKLDKVFEQFYRVSGDMQHTFPGLGLGLYISSEIIKRESGKIWVTSSKDKGSTFCFSLPVMVDRTEVDVKNEIKTTM